MARKLTPEEMAKMKADFDPPAAKAEDARKAEETPKRKGKGNPNGRPASPTPRTATLTVRLTDAEKLKLEEAARLIGETKTGVIVEGIDFVYSKAIAAEKKRQREGVAD